MSVDKAPVTYQFTYDGKEYSVRGASYVGFPEDGTMMYVTEKVNYLIEILKGHEGCVCFVDKSVQVPADIQKTNEIIICDNAAYEYSKCAEKIADKADADKKYMLTEGGYYLGEGVKIGRNARIEPGCLIGHGVIIGDNALLLSGCKIKNAIIGNDFICNENAVVGGFSFTLTKDDEGNLYRTPSLGGVIIGNHVEVGVCNDISRGACGDTIIDDYVKLNAQVHIGHESHVHSNVTVSAGAVIAGFVDVYEHGYLGVNSCVKNRIEIGKGTKIGMGAVVSKSLPEDVTAIGNPARTFNKNQG